MGSCVSRLGIVTVDMRSIAAQSVNAFAGRSAHLGIVPGTEIHMVQDAADWLVRRDNLDICTAVLDRQTINSINDGRHLFGRRVLASVLDRNHQRCRPVRVGHPQGVRPIRVSMIHRIVLSIAIEVRPLVEARRIRLQEPPKRRQIVPRLVVVERGVGVQPLASVAIEIAGRPSRGVIGG